MKNKKKKHTLFIYLKDGILRIQLFLNYYQSFEIEKNEFFLN